MSQHVFLCEELRQDSTQLTLPQDEALHMAKVLRLETGDAITLINGKGISAEATIQCLEMHGRNCSVECRIDNVISVPLPRPALRLYIAPPKGKNMDLLLKEATELGISRITPIICKYSVSKPEESKANWRQHLIAACKQSRNPWLPQIDAPLPFATALEQGNELHFLGAVPREGNTAPMPDLAYAAQHGAALWIGPEGGFSPEEETALFAKNAVPLTVGNWILRVETAVPALLGYMYAILK
ncbi:MAG: 16S rRNA (uracil(1498)-N(3))-methyltransferase [Victivallales bacterium]|nr:16S rRNA (uracil(1498)-N(3))-methyltransferase [Victivallales bacterium]